MLIAPGNSAQAQAWNGRDGDLWTSHDDHYNATVQRHSARLMAAADIRPIDRVLDIGCGCGQTTREAARLAPSGWALGVDLSARMLQRARDLSERERLTNIGFQQADAEVQPFDPASFDVVISRFGTMFFGDPVAAFTNLGRALRPGGRLAMLTWRELARNEWVRALGAALAAERAPQPRGHGSDTPVQPAPQASGPGAFSLAEDDRVRHILSAAEFDRVGFVELVEPVWLGDGVDDAIGFVSTIGFAKSTLDRLDQAAAAAAIERLRSTLALHATSGGVLFDSCAWLVTAHRTRLE